MAFAMNRLLVFSSKHVGIILASGDIDLKFQYGLCVVLI